MMLSELFNKESKGERFFCIPSVKNPRIIVALKSRKKFLQGLKIHNTASFKNKLIKKAIKNSYFFLKRFSGKILYSSDLLDEFIVELEEKIKKDNLSIGAAYIGTESKSRKITLQIIDNYKIAGYLKVTNLETVKEFIKNEYDIIEKLRGSNLKSIIPYEHGIYSLNNYLCYYQINCSDESKSVKSKLSESIIESVLDFQKKIKPELEFKEYIDLLSNFYKEKINDNKFVGLLEEIKEKNYPLVLKHGDFVPYNLRRKNKKTVIIDWEYAGFSIPLFDLISFLFQFELYVKKKRVDEIILKILFDKKNMILMNKVLENYNLKFEDYYEMVLLYFMESVYLESIRGNNFKIEDNPYYKGLNYLLDNRNRLGFYN